MSVNRCVEIRTSTSRRRGLWALISVALLLLAISYPSVAQEAPEITEGKVEAELDANNDRDVEKRLEATFDTLDILSAVEVSVNAGVVHLSGMADSARARELAAQLARQVEGVTAVENDIEENRSVAHRLNVAIERLVDRAWSLLDGLPLLLIALAVLLASLALSRLAVSWDLPFTWLTENIFLRDLARQAVRVAIIIGGALIALEIMDATALVGAVLGAAGVVGLAVGFAFRDLVENYIASILLSVRRPFSPRDLVEIEGHLGTVARLTSRATTLVTPDGNHVRIPNGTVFKATIENYTRNPQRRFSFGVAVGVDEDLVAAADLGKSILAGMNGILEDPGPLSRVEELGDSSVTLTFYAWVDQRAADFGKVRSEAMRLVKQAFDRQEIEMPEPIHRVRVETLPERGTAPKSPPPSPESDEAGDISPDSHVEDLIAEESVGAGPDLLAEEGMAE